MELSNKKTTTLCLGCVTKRKAFKRKFAFLIYYSLKIMDFASSFLATSIPVKRHRPLDHDCFFNTFPK